MGRLTLITLILKSVYSRVGMEVGGSHRGGRVTLTLILWTVLGVKLRGGGHTHVDSAVGVGGGGVRGWGGLTLTLIL